MGCIQDAPHSRELADRVEGALGEAAEALVVAARASSLAGEQRGPEDLGEELEARDVLVGPVFLDPVAEDVEQAHGVVAASQRDGEVGADVGALERAPFGCCGRRQLTDSRRADHAAALELAPRPLGTGRGSPVVGGCRAVTPSPPLELPQIASLLPDRRRIARVAPKISAEACSPRERPLEAVAAEREESRGVGVRCSTRNCSVTRENGRFARFDGPPLIDPPKIPRRATRGGWIPRISSDPRGVLRVDRVVGWCPGRIELRTVISVRALQVATGHERRSLAARSRTASYRSAETRLPGASTRIDSTTAENG